MSTLTELFVWLWLVKEDELTAGRSSQWDGVGGGGCRLDGEWTGRQMSCSAFWWHQCGIRSHQDWIKASRYCDDVLSASGYTRSPVFISLLGLRAIVCPQSRLSDDELFATGERLRDRPGMLPYCSTGYGVIPVLQEFLLLSFLCFRAISYKRQLS